MATQKEIKVIINGEEYVSDAARKATDGVEGFTGKMKGWFKSFVDFKAAWDLVSGAAQRLSGVIRDSFAEYDELQKSQRKLEGTSKITGLSLDYLREVAKRGREEFGLSKGVANDYGTEVAKLEVASGGAASATDLLSAFLNIGAARGLSASESMLAVRQALLGIDEGTDKLFGKNPSGLWADYALVIGKSAGKFTDMDKQAALAWATIEAGNKTLGSYSEYLDKAEGRQEQFNNRMIDAQVAFATALNPLRLLTLELGTNLMPVVKDLVVLFAGALILSITLVGNAFNLLRSVVANVVNAIGYLLHNTNMQVWAYEQAEASNALIKQFQDLRDAYGRLKRGNDEASESIQGTTGSLSDVIPSAKKAGEAFHGVINPLDRANDLFKKTGETVEGIGPRANASATAITNHGKATVESADKGKKATVDAAAESNKALDQWAQDHGKLSTAVTITTTAIDELGEAARTQLSPEQLSTFTDHMQTLADRSRAVADELERVPAPVQRSAQETQKMVRDVADVARSALDAAQAFGIVDDHAASALNSAINIASSLGKLAGGDFAGGLTGIVSGIANIVTTMVGGDPERRRLLRDNNTQLEKLRREGVRLSTSASGDTIAKAKNVLTPELAADLFNKSKLGVNSTQTLNQILAGAGLAVSDLDSIAKDLGINIRNKDGNIDFAALQQLVTGMQTPGFGSRLGSGFSGQLDFFRDSQQLSGASGVTEYSDLVAFLRNVGGVSALDGIDFSDPETARNKLFEIFTSLNNGTLDPGSLGQLTGEQFRDLLFEIIQGLGNGGASSGPVSGGDTGGGGGSGGDTIDIPGVGVVTLSTGDMVTAALEAQTEALAPMLKEANTYQMRTADATEGSWFELKVIRGLLESADFVGTVNTRLEAIRQAEAAFRGEGLTF